MTRLGRFIGRIVSQRACIDRAAKLTAVMSGPVFEMGLGNGRTFDHIRARFTDRPRFVFDRVINCHPSTIPTEEQMVLGDVFETVPIMLK